jgi:hypothetical protein
MFLMPAFSVDRKDCHTDGYFNGYFWKYELKNKFLGKCGFVHGMWEMKDKFVRLYVPTEGCLKSLEDIKNISFFAINRSKLKICVRREYLKNIELFIESHPI